MNNSLSQKRSHSPISYTKFSQDIRFDFSSLCKPKIEQVKQNLNFSFSPKHTYLKTGYQQQGYSSCKNYSPSSTNKFFIFSSYLNQSPNSKINKFSYQNENNLPQQQLNLSKIKNAFQKLSSSDNNELSHQNNYLITQNKKNNTQEETNIQSDTELEEEVSIWEEKELKTNGIDTNLFVDRRGEQLDFYQIYRLRSALYQETYVPRSDTIQEVQILSQHFNKEISLESLQQQQSYLDRFYKIQNNNQNRKKRKENLNNLPSKKNLKDFSQKCQTERSYRPKTSYEQNQVTSNKLKQQSTNQKSSNQIKQFQKQLLNIYPEEIQKEFQDPQSKINQQVKQKNQQSQSHLYQQQLKQQYNSKRRQKISIDQEKAQKMMQKKIVPIKQITLMDEDDYDNPDDSKNTSQSFDNVSPKSNNKLNLSNGYKYRTANSQYDNKVQIQKVGSNQRKQNVTQTQKSVISHLQKIVSSKTKQSNKYVQYTK